MIKKNLTAFKITAQWFVLNLIIGLIPFILVVFIIKIAFNDDIRNGATREYDDLIYACAIPFAFTVLMLAVAVDHYLSKLSFGKQRDIYLIILPLLVLISVIITYILLIFFREHLVYSKNFNYFQMIIVILSSFYCIGMKFLTYKYELKK